METNAASTSKKRTVLTTCPRDCYDACGMAITIADNKIFRVGGDPKHPVSRGKLCPKCAVAYNNTWLDPDSRITQPLRRTGRKGEGRFEPVSWDQALSEIAEKLQNIIQEKGARTILNTHYTGTFALLGFLFPMRFFNRLGATEVNPDTVCNNAGHTALDYNYGSSLDGFDPRTAKDAECILVWGANPSSSASHIDKYWLSESSAKVVVVDPIRTETAEAADLHLQNYPGSDAALAFGIMHVLLRDEQIDRDYLANNAIGWEQLEEKLLSCTPDWTEEKTGVPAHFIEQAAKIYGSGSAMLWLGQGLQRQNRGGNAMRACSLLPAVTGNFGKAGSGFLYLNGFGNRNIDEDYVSGSHLGEGSESISHMDLADCLEDPDRSQAFFCWNANSLASNPQQTRQREALSREDLLTVVLDIFPTDTADYADYILPAASFLEHDDLVVSYFNLSLSAQVKAVEPMGASLQNSEIFRCLAKAMGFTEAELFESDRAIIDRVLKGSGVGETFESLSEKGTVPIAKDPVLQFTDGHFPTPSGKIEIASKQAEEDGHPLIPEPHADLDPESLGSQLKLLSPASAWLLNSSYGIDPKIEKQLRKAKVILHPEEASNRELFIGDQVSLYNDTGEINLELAVSDQVPRGVALSYKGFWPKRQQGSKANINVLNPGIKSDMGESSTVHSVLVEIARV